MNMVVLGTHVVVPDPMASYGILDPALGLWGEDKDHNRMFNLATEDENGDGRYEGHGFLKEYIRSQFTAAGVSAHFIDSTDYHQFGGEIHCASNVTRQ